MVYELAGHTTYASCEGHYGAYAAVWLSVVEVDLGERPAGVMPRIYI